MKQGFVAVEGLDKREARDKHVFKPKAKKTRANRPRFADKENLGNDTSVQSNGSSDSCAQDVLPNVPGDTAPTPAVTQCKNGGRAQSTTEVDGSDG